VGEILGEVDPHVTNAIACADACRLVSAEPIGVIDENDGQILPDGLDGEVDADEPGGSGYDEHEASFIGREAL
jgi:hypothetical protein